jgi:DNA-binding response OmpR family regulator
MKKVVVAEASSTIKSVADTLLRQNGYDVICTSDGLQAWEVIQSERPDLVIAGLGLSGMSGLQLCRQVSAKGPGTPVILMTGVKDVLTDDQLRSSGARGRLKKPFSPRDLLDSVDKVVGQGRGAAAGEADRGKMISRGPDNAEVFEGNPAARTADGDLYDLDWKELEDVGDSGEEPEAETEKDPKRETEEDPDSQQLVVDEDQYNLVPLPDDEVPDEGQQRVPDENDEDYEWFVGEMRREIGGDSSAKERTARRADREKPSDVPGKRTHSDEMTFEDLSPAPSARQSQKSADLAVAEDVEKKNQTADGLTQNEIEKIAEKVVSRLAERIAGQLDKETIYEAIRTVLKSRAS